MKNNNVTLAVGAIALLLILKSRSSQPAPQPYYPQQSYVPPQPPPSNGQAWANWVNTIVNSYGTVASLWQPGGPFYQQNISPQQAQNIATNFATGFNSFP